mmetsp:Transcript_22388/g.54705  ORF Transcript_22388/g.54705 Transcript_22388/m.54705 type:complete len:258 (+) Transcript_22388:210-983(+)
MQLHFVSGERILQKVCVHIPSCPRRSGRFPIKMQSALILFLHGCLRVARVGRHILVATLSLQVPALALESLPFLLGLALAVRDGRQLDIARGGAGLGLERLLRHDEGGRRAGARLLCQLAVSASSRGVRKLLQVVDGDGEGLGKGLVYNGAIVEPLRQQGLKDFGIHINQRCALKSGHFRNQILVYHFCRRSVCLSSYRRLGRLRYSSFASPIRLISVGTTWRCYMFVPPCGQIVLLTLWLSYSGKYVPRKARLSTP